MSSLSLPPRSGAWAVELANEGADRANFFAVCGVVGVFGIFFGLGLSAAPLLFGGIFLAISALLSNGLCLWYIEEKTPLSKRSFIPTVTNLTSVYYNKQFVIFISAMVFIYFINTVPVLYLFFLTYVMDQGEDMATLLYLLSVGGFVIMGFFAMPMAPRLIVKYGKLAVADFCLKSMVVLGTLMFVASFIHPAMVVAVFSVVGFNAALSGWLIDNIMDNRIETCADVYIYSGSYSYSYSYTYRSGTIIYQ
jgi:Na+/melibiose symporter-like transporter